MNTAKPIVHFRGDPHFYMVPFFNREGDAEVASVFTLDHPNLGCMPVRTSEVIKKFDDGSFETLNTIYKPEGK